MKMLNYERSFLFLSLLLAGALVLSGCMSDEQPSPTVEPQASTATQVLTDEPAAEESPLISFDTGSLASGFWVETVDAVPDNGNAPYWEVLPEYARATLDDYTISNHIMQPQIFVYPIDELITANEGAAMMVASLQTLLTAPQEIENMPMLPLFNAAQVLHTQVQYLDFQSGRGVRYLTFLSQGIMPINNYDLIYTYQGLTGDGKYYVAAILPVSHPSLPEDGMMTGNEPPEFTSDYLTYVTNVVTSLNEQPSNSFVPDLTLLDAMMASLEVK
jgi:hypothetical protein